MSEVEKVLEEWRAKQAKQAGGHSPGAVPQPLTMPGSLDGLKAGWKTSEFWATLGSQALALLVIFGVITSGDSQFLGDQLGKAIGAVAALVGVFWQTKSYVESRTAVKLIDQENRAELLRSK